MSIDFVVINFLFLCRVSLSIYFSCSHINELVLSFRALKVGERLVSDAAAALASVFVTA